MGQRRWNPGIKREGLFETVFDLRRNEGNSGICRRDWGGKSRSDRRGLLGESSRYGKRIGISVFLKSKSLLIEGMISVIIKTESLLIASIVNSYQQRSRKVGFWKIRIFSFLFKVVRVIKKILICLMDSRVSIATGDYGRFGLNGIDLWQRGVDMEEYYKDGLRFNFNTAFESLHSYKLLLLIFLFGFLFTMFQSQLIGSSGEMKTGDGARKRLKISVPHFNNSDLIKGYSKTLIGRCMNPEEQNVKFLMVTLPKIWNLEEKVVGMDLGLGRFQFDFDAEEDI